MKKFRVGVSYSGSVVVEVEACCEDNACEKAEMIVEAMDNAEFLNELEPQHAETNIIEEIKDE